MTKEEAMIISVESGTESVSSVIDYLLEKFPKEINGFDKTDFLETSMPYEYIDTYAYDPLKRNQVKERVKARAVELKIGARTFNAMYADYKKTHPDKPEESYRLTRFPDQPLPLMCGKWICDELGVRMETEKGDAWACLHPIMPIARLKNIDTGIEKIKVAFYDNGRWRTAIFDRKTLSVSSKITDLADYGIAVTSDNAPLLVKYFLCTLQSNPDYIPELNSVAHLGWTDSGKFIPYDENIEFDGEKDFLKRYKAVSPKGSEEEWIKGVFIRVIVSSNPVARITFAAAFASILIKPLNANNFWVHLWGESGTAKTVLTMCAASAWANPVIGEYITTFNSTYVGNERGAAFCGSMPYILDELQILDSRRDTDGLIYMLTEGCGRSRGNRSGGLDATPRWKNCVISTGERPINTQSSGGGAAARVIEIEVKKPLFDAETAKSIVNVITQNYGFWGKRYVEAVRSASIEELKDRYNVISIDLIKRGIMDKQAQSGALIILASEMIAKMINDKDAAVKPEEILPFIKTKDDVDVNRRAYEYICGKIVENQTKFVGTLERIIDVWGKFDDSEHVSIIKTRFDQLCAEGGFSPKPLLSWLADKGLLERDAQGQFTRVKSINSRNARCVCLTIIRGDTSDELKRIAEEYPDF